MRCGPLQGRTPVIATRTRARRSPTFGAPRRQRVDGLTGKLFDELLASEGSDEKMRRTLERWPLVCETGFIMGGPLADAASQKRLGSGSVERHVASGPTKLGEQSPRLRG
ncbi:protein of unknown function (plasmid) [Caballeronia sp. S22]